MVISTVFYDGDYRRMVTNAHEDGKAIPIPVGAMFVCEWAGRTVPEDATTDNRGSAKTGDGN